MRVYSLIKNIALTMVCLVLIIPILIYGFPFLVGADGSYTVMGESMNPALRPGDLVIVKGEEPIDIGDIVTVESGKFTYTHRVVDKLEGDGFRLKGDANEEPDQGLVEHSQIVGKVVLVFPFSYLYTPYGLFSALLVPAILIIGKQVYTIHQFTKRRNKRETMRWRRKSHSALNTGTLLLALILVVSTTRIIAPHFIGGSSSYFSDLEWSTGFFRAGIWEASASVVIEPFTLNLDSQGQWVTAYIDTEFDENDIRVDSVMLDSSIRADWGEVQGSQLMVKFDRASVVAYLIDRGYVDGDELELTISGRFIEDIKFSASTTVSLKHGEDES